MRKLPKGWVLTALEQLAADTKYPIGDGDHGQINPECYSHSGIPYIRVGDIGWGKFEPKAMVYIPEDIHNKNLKSELIPGDIVIAKTGATIGKCSIIPDSIERANTTSSVGKVSVEKKVTSPKWVLFYFLSKEFLDQMWAVSQKTAQPGFSIREMKRFIIPLAPLNEQNRIVAKLEKILPKINECNERLDKIPIIIKRFRQSVLAAACSGRLTADWREKNPGVESASELLKRIQYSKALICKNVKKLNKPFEELTNRDQHSNDRLPAKWQYTNLGSIVSDFNYGTSKKSDYLYKGVPVLRIPNIVDSKINFNKMKYLQSQEINDTWKIKNGDVLIVRSNGSRDLVGKNALIENIQGEYAFASYMIRIRPLEVNPKYVWFLLNNSIIKEQFYSKAKSSAGINNINTEELSSTVIPLPPLEEQQEIVRRVESLFIMVDQIEQRYKKCKAYLDKLTQSVLAKAFRGELVPQDPSDEPASVLLERIKQEKAKLEEDKKPQKAIRKQKSPKRKKAGSHEKNS